MLVEGARWVYILSGLRLFALLCLCAGAAPAQDLGNIAGDIRLQDGGFPNELLQVSLQTRGAIVNATYCDNEGRFSFTELLPNPYYVEIQADGFEPVRLQVVVNPRVAQTNLVHIILHRIEKHSVGVPSGENGDVINVAELARSYPPEVKKEFLAGQKAEEQNDIPSAIEHYRAALRLAPDFYQAHNNLGGAFVKKGDLKSAEAELRRALELNPNSAQAQFNLGNVLYLTNRNAEAKQTLEEGLRHAASSAVGRYFLGCVLTRLRDFGPAEEQLKSARQLDPKLPQVPIALATLYLQTGRQPEAVQMFEQFLRQFPADPLAPKVRAALNKLSHETRASAPPAGR